MLDSYAWGNQTELWNNRRVLDYLAGQIGASMPMRQSGQFVNRLAECGNYLPLVCDPPVEGDRYVSPVEDEAPWYDPAVPESADFAGLFVEEVSGFDSTIERDVSRGALFGGALGPLRHGPRELVVTGYLFAATCCAASYGLSWLTEALVDTGCSGCSLSELVMLKCCPPDSVEDPQAIDYVRTMQRVGVTEGPKVVDKFGKCCDACGYTTYKVQFTLVAEIPHMFSDLTYSVYNETFPAEQELLGWYSFCEDCPDITPVTFDPTCGGPVAPMAPPPSLGLDNCYCDPWCTRRICGSFTNELEWNQVASVIEITAGSGRMKNFKLSIWENNALGSIPCPCEMLPEDDVWRCVEPCNVVEIPELPSGSVLTIDGRTRVATLRLAGGTTLPGTRYMSGALGKPYEWLDLSHCASLCFIATAECGVADNATLSIGHAARYLAG